MENFEQKGAKSTDESSGETDDDIRAVWRMLVELLDYWGASHEQSNAILKLNEIEACEGKSFPPELKRELLTRAALLIFFRKSLLMLYPGNPEIRQTWMSYREPGLGNQIALELMATEGLTGMRKVRDWLTERLSM